MFSVTVSVVSSFSLRKTHFIIIKTSFLWEFDMAEFKGLAELANLTVNNETVQLTSR